MRPEILNPLFASITRQKGVGPALAAAIARLAPPPSGQSMPILRDVLFHLPVGVIDRRQTFPLHSAPADTVATFVVIIERHLAPRRGFSRQPYKVVCSNETGTLTLVFFHASEDYIKRALPIGEQRVISGRTEIFDAHLQMTHPDVIAPVSQLKEVQQTEAIYPLTAGITSRKLASIIQTALKTVPQLPEWIDAQTLAMHKWAGWRESLCAAHAPKNAEALQHGAPARMRLAYDEIFANQLYLAKLRHNRDDKPGRIFPESMRLKPKLIDALPFKLTAGQRQVIAEIEQDMQGGQRMARLLQGDVGSGKTIVALMCALSAIEAGAQVAFMVPTGIIAQQHFDTIRCVAEPLGLRTELLTGHIKGAQRQPVLDGLESGEVHIVVGTHALFQDTVEFHDLGLVVIDEQHRFGVGQRMALTGKGASPHLLQMTATPIPRSLTMTLYGDMDCSLLTEKPAERLPITTRIIALSRYGELMDGMHRALAKGEKIYWICPLIEDSLSDSGSVDVAAAQSRHTEFLARFGPVIGLVHGRMKAEQREQEMQRFAEGTTKILVATTVVEVGVDVRDATIIIIEQAERFGLAQLHQLRGRVGRGAKPSACVLLYSDKSGDVAKDRLGILRDSEDGFRIAEEDLRLRGGGDLLGTRQSGVPLFRFVDLVQHRPLISQARSAATEIIKENPSLDGEESKALRTLLALFGYEYGF